jgi:hypothetical protein
MNLHETDRKLYSNGFNLLACPDFA